jgi:hypothetical protein
VPNLTDADELFVHQLPQPAAQVALHHHHWRESHFFELHDPAGGPDGDVVFFTMATYAAQQRLDSLQMGRVGGERRFGVRGREADGDPHTTDMPGARIEVVKPFEEVRLWAAEDSAIGLDLTYRARTKPYGLRRGTMRAGDDVVWDQSHLLQSGTYTGTITTDGVTREVDGWLGQRDHSWGIRDHGRCPLWTWYQIQLDDGALGVWHWELANGAHVYTDGAWMPAGDSDPVPLVGFENGMRWIGPYGKDGSEAVGLEGTCRFTLEGGRTLEVQAQGTFAQPYEPFHRGGLNLMAVEVDDGRTGTAIYEVTGARHHHFFPDTDVEGVLPT